MSIYPFPYSQAAKLDPRITIPRPIYDAHLTPILDSALLPEEFSLDLLRGIAQGEDACPHGTFVFNANTILKDQPHLNHTEYSIDGPDNNTIILSVFTPKEATTTLSPVLYHIHGGGMVSGDRFTALTPVIELLEGIDCVIVSIEHRLAPETRAPGPSEDCYAGLIWISENAAILGINHAEIVVLGVSGGGGLAAATCLMARDRKSPSIPIKNAIHSMIDAKACRISSSNMSYGSNEVTPYMAPARATDLSNLPSTYIDAAECEQFRGPAVAYASNMWRGGTTCELHIWPGAWHGFDMLNNPDVLLIHAANEAKINWFKRVMQP